MTAPYWPDKPRILLSYAYAERATPNGLAEFKDADLLIDSGAFTAFTKGAKIPLEAYCDYLLEHAHLINHGVVLDVIGDWKGTARNHERMMRLLGDKVNVMPVWHMGSPEEELHRLCKEHPYVGVGGIVSMAKDVNKFMRQMIRIHKIAAEYGTDLHGLGVTGRTAMTRLPWHTVDSSSWISYPHHGMMLFADRAGNLLTQKSRLSEKISPANAALLRRYGMKPEELVAGYGLVGKNGARGREQVAEAYWAICRSLMHVEGTLRAKHGRDLRVYFAAASNHHLRHIMHAHKQGSPFQ